MGTMYYTKKEIKELVEEVSDRLAFDEYKETLIKNSRCPFCTGGRIYFFKETNLYICPSCEFMGDVILLTMAKDQLPLMETVKMLKEDLDIENNRPYC